MKEYFKYANGYVNIKDEFFFLTNSGNWFEILELKEKVVPTHSSHAHPRSSWKDELIDALVTLGFSSKESADVVDTVASENPDADSLSREVLLKQALQMRGRRS